MDVSKTLSQIYRSSSPEQNAAADVQSPKLCVLEAGIWCSQRSFQSKYSTKSYSRSVGKDSTTYWLQSQNLSVKYITHCSPTMHNYHISYMDPESEWCLSDGTNDILRVQKPAFVTFSNTMKNIT